MNQLRASSLRLVVAVLALSLLQACSPLTFTVGTRPEDRKLKTTRVYDEPGHQQVAMIDVSGMIFNGHKPALLDQGENPVAMLHEQLERARQDDNVKAVLLRINSPGGTVTATDAMYREVMRFRAQTGKPVVAVLMDVAASGGYFLACSADQIVAYPTCITGSIGVYMQTLSVKPALSRLGVQADAITSGPNKAAGSPLAVMTPEQRAVLQQMVDDFYARFVDTVKRARPGIPPEKLAEVTDGRVVTGTRAVGLGLVDQTGDIYDGHALAKKLAGVTSADLVSYHRQLAYVASPYAAAPAAGGVTQVNLAQFNLTESMLQSTAGVYYLWQPQMP